MRFFLGAAFGLAVLATPVVAGEPEEGILVGAAVGNAQAHLSLPSGHGVSADCKAAGALAPNATIELAVAGRAIAQVPGTNLPAYTQSFCLVRDARGNQVEIQLSLGAPAIVSFDTAAGFDRRTTELCAAGRVHYNDIGQLDTGYVCVPVLVVLP